MHLEVLHKEDLSAFSALYEKKFASGKIDKAHKEC
jgi:hypothetical protein